MIKVIPNTEGIYSVSNEGIVYKGLKAISLHPDRKVNGYLQCGIKINGKYQKQKVHRIVAMAFIGDLTGLTVNHKDGVKYNNNIENLEIITFSENFQHSKTLKSFKVGIEKRREKAFKLNKLEKEELLALRNEMSISSLAKKFNIGSSTVSDYIRRAGLIKEHRFINQYK